MSLASAVDNTDIKDNLINAYKELLPDGITDLEKEAISKSYDKYVQSGDIDVAVNYFKRIIWVNILNQYGLILRSNILVQAYIKCSIIKPGNFLEYYIRNDVYESFLEYCGKNQIPKSQADDIIRKGFELHLMSNQRIEKPHSTDPNYYTKQTIEIDCNKFKNYKYMDCSDMYTVKENK